MEKYCTQCEVEFMTFKQRMYVRVAVVNQVDLFLVVNPGSCLNCHRQTFAISMEEYEREDFKKPIQSPKRKLWLNKVYETIGTPFPVSEDEYMCKIAEGISFSKYRLDNYPKSFSKSVFIRPEQKLEYLFLFNHEGFIKRLCRLVFDKFKEKRLCL